MPTQPPEVIQAIEEQRARLQAHEAETMREMARRWIAVEDSLKAEMLDLALYLDELKAKGETVSAERLLQMARYRSMVADARAQHEQYSAWAADAMASDQREMVAQGIYDAQQLIEAAGLDARIAAVTFDHINVNAVEFMAGFAGDGTPLYDLLRASYPESVVRLTDNLVKGLAAGKGPRSTAAMMAQDMAGNLDRALLIAITEQNRALRAGSLEQMKQSKVVKGYVRRAQRNAQVCAACLALDGQEQDTDEIFASHPRCHCYAQPLLRFGKTPSFPSGSEWLSKQSDAVQEKVLGPGKFKLFKQGALDWGSVAKVHDDPVWGPTIKQGLMGDVKKVRERVDAKTQRIKFTSEITEVIGKTFDLNHHFPEGTPGREYIVSNNVQLTSRAKDHILNDHTKQISWLEANLNIIQSVLSDPEIIDVKPFRDRGRWAITHVSHVENSEFDYLVIGIRHGKTASDEHDVLTMFLADKRFIIDRDGSMKPRWKKIK